MFIADDIGHLVKKDSAGSAKSVEIDQHKMEVAKKFEAMFVNELMKSMRKTVEQMAAPEKQNMANSFYTSMLDSEYSKMLSERGSLGLAAVLYKQLDGSETLPSESLPQIEPALYTKNLNNVRTSRVVEKQVSGENLRAWIDEAAQKNDMDPLLIRSVIRHESAGKVDAVSPAGAKGLMQLMDGTARELGVRNVFDGRENILGGSAYLRKMLDRFDGDEKLALAAYNAGPGNVSRYGGVPPFAETENYVKNVLEFRDDLKSGKQERI